MSAIRPTLQPYTVTYVLLPDTMLQPADIDLLQRADWNVYGDRIEQVVQARTSRFASRTVEIPARLRHCFAAVPTVT